MTPVQHVGEALFGDRLACDDLSSDRPYFGQPLLSTVSGGSAELGRRVADGLQADGDVRKRVLLVLFVFERQTALVIDPFENPQALQDVEVTLADNCKNLLAAAPGRDRPHVLEVHSVKAVLEALQRLVGILIAAEIVPRVEHAPIFG